MSSVRTTGTEPELFTVTVGPEDGAHLVLVHGAMDRSAGMVRLSRRLADDFRVTRYDRRGYGKSRPHDGPFEMEYQVADLESVILSERQHDDPVLLFGHSYGGNVALALAARRPELVRAVVVFESPLSWQPGWPGQSAGLAASRGSAHDVAERFMRRLIGDRRWERLPPSSRHARRSEGPALVAELADLAQRAPWDASRIQVPVVALAGERGQPHHVAGTRDLVAMIDGAEFGMIPGAKHFGPNTHSDEVAGVVRGLARRVGHGSTPL